MKKYIDFDMIFQNLPKSVRIKVWTKYLVEFLHYLVEKFFGI